MMNQYDLLHIVYASQLLKLSHAMRQLAIHVTDNSLTRFATVYNTVFLMVLLYVYRLGDSQSNLKPMAAAAIADVMISINEEVAPRYIKAFCEQLVAGTADNKYVLLTNLYMILVHSCVCSCKMAFVITCNTILSTYMQLDILQYLYNVVVALRLIISFLYCYTFCNTTYV
jgi:hypothetical protein